MSMPPENRGEVPIVSLPHARKGGRIVQPVSTSIPVPTNAHRRSELLLPRSKGHQGRGGIKDAMITAAVNGEEKAIQRRT
jgi:hypothetical protein